MDAKHQGDPKIAYDGRVELLEDFVLPAARQALFGTLRAELAWKTETLRMFGRTIVCPRRVAWYGDAGLIYRYSGIDHHAPGWPLPLAKLRDAIARRSDFLANSVLCNLYRNGADHMGWHADAEKALGRNPTIASLSLGAARELQFRHDKTAEVVRVALPPGSLLLMRGETQHHWKHRLPKCRNACGERINLTFRRVEG